MSAPSGEPNGENHWDTSISGLSSGFVWHPRFWTGEFQALKPVYKSFAAPAFALALGNVLAVVANGTLMDSLSRSVISSDNPANDLTKLLGLSVSLFLAVVASLVVSFWGLWQFMVRLSALSALLLKGEKAEAQGLSSSVAAINARKSDLVVAWTIGSLYLLVPALPEAVLIALLIASGMTVFGQPCLVLPNWVPFAAVPAVACLSVWVVTYTGVLVAVTGVPPLKPHQAPNLALRIFFRHFFTLNSLACAVGLVNVLLSGPQLLVSGTAAGDFISKNVLSGIALQIWFGISSMVLWPLSMSAFCRTLRPLVKQ